MLDEAEFKLVWQLYGDCIRATKEFRQESGLPLQHLAVRERMLPVSKEYERLTGVVGCPPNAVMHHEIARYGPPCQACGKPLRTPKAKHCAQCGAWR